MIKYILECKNKHKFESWFSTSKEFEKLQKNNLLECIHCESKAISKSIMSPNILNTKEKNYTSTIIVDLPHKPGALGNISSLIGMNKGNILNVEMVEKKKDHLQFSFDLP